MTASDHLGMQSQQGDSRKGGETVTKGVPPPLTRGPLFPPSHRATTGKYVSIIRHPRKTPKM